MEGTSEEMLFHTPWKPYVFFKRLDETQNENGVFSGPVSPPMALGKGCKYNCCFGFFSESFVILVAETYSRVLFPQHLVDGRFLTGSIS